VFTAERMVTQWSSYVLYNLYPDCTTFVDCRHVNGSIEIFNEFFDIYNGTSRQAGLLERYRVDIILSDRDFRFHPARSRTGMKYTGIRLL